MTFAESVAAYESLFREAIDLPVELPLHVVYHVAGMGRWWKPIVLEQLDTLAAAGLRSIRCTHVGVEPNWVVAEAAARGIDLALYWHSPKVQLWESPAIRLIERLAVESDRPVLYLHSKAVSRDPAKEPEYHEWRRLMMGALVAKWREHVPALAQHDAVGVNWWTEHTHFSGNFWLASAAWLRRLPRFDSYERDRYSSERWIGAVPGCRAKSLLCADRKFWSDDREWMRAALMNPAPALHFPAAAPIGPSARSLNSV